MCHCLECQKRTGSVFAAQARFPMANVRISGRATEWSRSGDEGGRATFRFCPECGAIVYWTMDFAPDSVGIPVGAFADPAFPPPTVSVYGSRKHAWVSLPHGAEEWD
jgi:hypothetical protein